MNRFERYKVTDFSKRCQALTAKGEQCKRKCKIIIPNTWGEHDDDGNIRTARGRRAHICQQHLRKWCQKKENGETLPLIDDGFLSAYNQYKYGSLVSANEVVDFDKLVIAPKWVARTE